MRKKYQKKKSDMVYVNTGEYKGQQGRVLEVLNGKDRAIVEGVNMASRHTKPNAANPQGGIVKNEAPVHISNLNLVDPSSGDPTRIRRERDDNNKLKRISKKSGEEIK